MRRMGRKAAEPVVHCVESLADLWNQESSKIMKYKALQKIRKS